MISLTRLAVIVLSLFLAIAALTPVDKAGHLVVFFACALLALLDGVTIRRP